MYSRPFEYCKENFQNLQTLQNRETSKTTKTGLIERVCIANLHVNTSTCIHLARALHFQASESYACKACVRAAHFSLALYVKPLEIRLP